MGNEKAAEEIVLTNRDIINFFADKSGVKCPKTQKLLNRIHNDPVLREKRRREEYIKFAFSIKRHLIRGGSKDDLPISCSWLETLTSDNNIDAFLEGTSLDELYEKSYEADFQRWHLIVSYYAYKCFKETERGHKSEEEFLNYPADKKGGVLYDGPISVSCTELLLWMFEVSAGKNIAEEVLQEGSEDLAGELKKKIKKAVSYSKRENLIKRYV